MKINVKLHSILRDYLPREAKGKTTLDLPPKTTVATVLETLKIDRQCIVMVNGEEIIDETHELQDNDDVQMLLALGGGL